MIELSQLNIYPVKSCAQISLNSARTSPFGLQYDRRWMLIDKNGVMLTQRKHPRMCLIQCELQQGKLTLNAPGMASIEVTAGTEQLSATVWEDTCQAFDCGSATADWLSTFLHTPARLVHFPENEIRQVDLNYASPGDITAFSDGFPYLLISQGSLDDLNTRLNTTVSMQRFRPNLVVSGTDAYAEDQWKQIRIGEIEFSLVKPCSRCVIPSIDPLTAEKSAEPVKTLASYRRRDNKVFFGQNLLAHGSGRLELGMPVEIIA